MNYLIIGAAGFVGGHLIDHLVSCEKATVVATKLKNEVLERSDCTIADLDILECVQLDGLFAEFDRKGIHFDCIIHLAAQSSVKLAWEKPALTVDINIKGVINLLECLRKRAEAAPRILLIGSAEEYGAVQEGVTTVDELMPPRPTNIYAVTKYCQNMIGGLYNAAYGLDTIMVRAFNHIGPRQLSNFVVSDFCHQVAEIEAGMREPVINVGNLSAKRDFTDVRDVVRAYSLLAKAGVPGQTYNVGSGHAVSIEEILHKILSCSTNHNIQVNVDKSRFRPVETPELKAEVSKLRNDTGWQPEINLEQSIRDTLAFWREQLQSQ